MKSCYLTVILFLVLVAAVPAQEFITLGFGFSGLFITSGNLDEFTEGYNLVHSTSLLTAMDGINNSLGYQIGLGYRRISDWNYAFEVGYQSFREDDAANFRNNEIRELNFQTDHLYAEAEFGKSMGNILIDGLVKFFFARNVKLETRLYAANGSLMEAPLNGTYGGEGMLALDLGIGIGIFRNPFLLMFKLSFPVYHNAGNEFLLDNSPEKKEAGTSIFPSDYPAFVRGDEYQGVNADLDGIKLQISAYFSFKVRGNP